MAGKAKRREFKWSEYTASTQLHEKNRIFFDWLTDDADRKKLYEQLSLDGNKPFAIKSRSKFLDQAPTNKSDQSDDRGATIYLVHNRTDISAIFGDSTHYSNQPYLDIGSGGFMLGLDPSNNPNLHAIQRQSLDTALKSWDGDAVKKLSTLAVSEAKVMGLRGKNFDLADFAEQAGLRFCIKLFGFATSDYSLLEESLRRAYRGMNYQMLGRHFLSEPLTLPVAKEWMGKLATRIAQLIDEYQHLSRYPRWDTHARDPRQDQSTLPDGVEPLSRFGLSGCTPVLKAFATLQADLTGLERTVVAVGTLAGMVGNIQASACIAVEAILSQLNDPQFNSPPTTSPMGLSKDPSLWKWIANAMKANPPAPYLPRIVVKQITTPSGQKLEPGDEVILLVGAGTNDSSSKCPYAAFQNQQEDSLIFGLKGGDANYHGPSSPHWCVGDFLARPIIEATVRATLGLPGIARRYDPITGLPMHLEKRWGFACEKFSLSYKRESVNVQQSLNVVMRIKAPIPENAERLKRVIAGGAPRIQWALNQSRHVHFAWFEIIENETKLVLHTVYDGDFESYLNHFALAVDDMFDQLFLSIEGAPPLPVRDFPNEFVDAIRRFNLAPLGGYFYSAYPSIENHKISTAAATGAL